jgi:hypothetical protein
MALILDLFSTDYGRVALAVILVSLGVAWGFHAFIHKKIHESEIGDTSNQ